MNIYDLKIEISRLKKGLRTQLEKSLLDSGKFAVQWRSKGDVYLDGGVRLSVLLGASRSYIYVDGVSLTFTLAEERDVDVVFEAVMSLKAAH